VSNALILTQHPVGAGGKAGSWEPDTRWRLVGGRVYATAINAMTLEAEIR
jgi:hypothetical protein